MATKKLLNALGMSPQNGVDTPPQYNGKKNGQMPQGGEELEKTSDQIAVEAVLSLAATKKEKHLAFPTTAFPKRVQAILNTFQDCDGYPIEYYYTNALVSVASLLGVAYKARYRRGHEHFPILYAALVGNSSAGKGRSMRPVFSSLFKIEKGYRDAYTAAMEKYHQEILFLDKKEKMPPRPAMREILMDNATLESLIRTMYRNPRGLLLNQEELLAWLKSMNAYRSGSDEQFWLKNWDAAFVKITRSSTDTMSIENPNCSVIGGIQPSLLHELLADGKGDSGFSARILFAYPEETIAPYDNDKFPDQSVYDNWHNIIEWIDELPNRIALPTTESEKAQVEDAVTIDCTDEAKAVYKAFFNKCADEINKAEDERIRSMMGKMQAYCMRFALILEIMNRASLHATIATPQYATPATPFEPEDDAQKEAQEALNTEGEEWEGTGYIAKKYTKTDGVLAWEAVQNDIKITAETMQGAKALTEYFIQTGKKVLQRLETPVETLKPEQQAWYKALPMDKPFRFVVAKESAAKVKLPEATFKRLLNRPDLFGRKNSVINGVEINTYIRKWA
jgi:hypothetical protein